MASATLSSPITTMLLLYLPYRLLVLGGILLCAASLLCSSFVPSLRYMFITYGLAYGIGVNFYNQTTMVVLLRMFAGSHESRATIIAATGSNVGVFILSPFVEHLLETFDWRISFRILSALVIVSCTPPVLLIGSYDNDHPCQKLSEHDRNETKYFDKVPCSTTKIGEAQLEVSITNDTKRIDTATNRWVRFISEAYSWIFFWGISLSALASTFFYINLVPFILSHDISRHKAAIILTLMAGGEILGKLLLSAFGDHLPFKRIYLLVFANCLAAILSGCLLITDTFAEISVIGASVGLSAAVYNSLPFSSGVEIFGNQKEMETSTLVFLGYGTGYLIGAAVTSGFFDLTGSYTISLTAVLGLFLVSASLHAMIPICRKSESSSKGVMELKSCCEDQSAPINIVS